MAVDTVFVDDISIPQNFKEINYFLHISEKMALESD